MKALRDALDKVHPLFAKGGPLAFAYPMYEALDTFLYTPGEVTHGSTHVRDGIDLKRMMITVVVALIPVTLFGMWNVGYQANHAIARDGRSRDRSQRRLALHDPQRDRVHERSRPITSTTSFSVRFISCRFTSSACLSAGTSNWSSASCADTRSTKVSWSPDCCFRSPCRHRFRSGRSRWESAFGVIVAKEVFGGTGRNFLNVALTSRAFLYFAYAGQISGDKVWTAVDGFSGATALGPDGQCDTRRGSVANPADRFARQRSHTCGAEPSRSLGWSAFLGTIQGCVGETSTLLCIVGAAILIATGIGSWKIMAGVVGGVIATSLVTQRCRWRHQPDDGCSFLLASGRSVAWPSGWSSWRPTRSVPR